MADRIGGNRPGPVELTRADEALNEPKATTTHKSGDAATPARVDTFEPSAKVSAQLENRLQGLAGKGVTKIQFSNEDIAYLASIFAAILTQNREADRLKRARLFAKAILKGKRLRKIFAGMPEAEMEEMCDIIGDVLDSTPVFAELVEKATDGARKLTGG